MLQLEEGIVDLFSKTIKDNDLAIDLEVAQKPKTIDVCVQASYNRIWEHGFMGFFKRKDSCSKTEVFKDQRQTNLAIKRVIFRYEFNSQLVFNSSSQIKWMTVV